MIKELPIERIKDAKEYLYKAQDSLVPFCSADSEIMQYIDCVIYELNKLEKYKKIVELTNN